MKTFMIGKLFQPDGTLTGTYYVLVNPETNLHSIELESPTGNPIDKVEDLHLCDVGPWLASRVGY